MRRNLFIQTLLSKLLTIKVPAGDDKFFNIIHDFQNKQGLIFHVNHLPADNLHESSSLIRFLKAKQFENVLLKLACIGLGSFHSKLLIFYVPFGASYIMF